MSCITARSRPRGAFPVSPGLVHDSWASFQRHEGQGEDETTDVMGALCGGADRRAVHTGGRGGTGDGTGPASGRSGRSPTPERTPASAVLPPSAVAPPGWRVRRARCCARPTAAGTGAMCHRPVRHRRRWSSVTSRPSTPGARWRWPSGRARPHGCTARTTGERPGRSRSATPTRVPSTTASPSSTAGDGLAMSDPVDGKYRILSTADGGRNWRVLPTRGMPEAQAGEAGFAASGQCLVSSGPRDVWLATGGAATARVLHSADRGLTWTASASTIPASTTRPGASSAWPSATATTASRSAATTGPESPHRTPPP